MKLISIGCAALALALSGCRTLAPPGVVNRSVDEAAIRQAERDWADRAVEGKADEFASFMAPEYVALRSNGLLRDKDTWVGQIRNSTTTYSKVDLSDMRIRFPTPDVAVVSATYFQVGASAGASTTGGGTYINTWVRINGKWQIVSSGFVRPPAK